MTIPVIHSLAKQFPTLEIYYLSTRSYESLFINLPSNIKFITAGLRGIHKGFTGINRLYDQLDGDHFDFVADFQSDLRSKYLRFRFKMSGSKTAVIQQGINEREELIRKGSKKLEPIKTEFERYHDVLSKLGFKFKENFVSIFPQNIESNSFFTTITGEKSNKKWIGIAPFAKQKGKIYPLDLMEKVISHFASNNHTTVFVFGGGDFERKIIDKWTERYPTIKSVVGKLNMSQELVIISQMDIMCSMDSANMHLASLVNVPVVSIWGSTHPYGGTMGWNQSLENAIQTDLPCRPCSSVFNEKKSCYRGDYACLYKIKPQAIIDHIEKLIL